MKKIISHLLALSMTISLFSGSAYAAFDMQNDTAVQDVVESFLKNYSKKALLYQETDLKANTVCDATLPMTLSAEQTFNLSNGTETLAEMQENISFIEEKAEYFKGFRQLYGIERTDLLLHYFFENITFSGNTATVEVSEVATFNYPQYEERALREALYTVDLVKIDGQWVIADITEEDWFDAKYKNTAEPFDSQTELAAMREEMENAPIVEPEPNIESSIEPLANASYRRPYSTANVVAYAYTYTRDAAHVDSGNRSKFYNSLFASYDSNGGDCMNFASQCVWAGFSGSQDNTSIKNHALPMDAEGTYLWYGAPKGASSSKTASWTSCMNFRKYLTGNYDGTGTSGSNNSTDIGLKTYDPIFVAANTEVLSVSSSSLIGAVGHVYSSTGDPYGHAIIITDAVSSGGTTSQLNMRYCAHTADRKNCVLYDDYPGKKILWRPQFFRTDVPLDNTIQVKMLRPVEINKSATPSFSTQEPQAKMTMVITAPNGATSQTSTTNARTCSYSNYQFTQKGLYKVDCYAKTTTSSEATCVTFYVLCYSMSDIT